MIIPIFHVAGHNTACQYLYSPKCVDGTGTLDGEAIERFWKNLNMLVYRIRWVYFIKKDDTS